MKTKVFNLIILDESGSMCSIAPATISGCNETLSSIRALQKEFEENQDQFISIYAFQAGGPVHSRYIVKNAPAAVVKDITRRDYDPNGCTPLYDAVGMTLADLKSLVATHDQAICNVTIITDGMENASTEYSLEQIQRMISQLKELGWKFSFIGANIDVERVAASLNIDPKASMRFTQDEKGTREMFEKQARARSNWSSRMNAMLANHPDADFKACCKRMAAEERDIDYFNAPDEDSNK